SRTADESGTRSNRELPEVLVPKKRTFKKFLDSLRIFKGTVSSRKVIAGACRYRADNDPFCPGSSGYNFTEGAVSAEADQEDVLLRPVTRCYFNGVAGKSSNDLLVRKADGLFKPTPFFQRPAVSCKRIDDKYCFHKHSPSDVVWTSSREDK